MTILLSFEEWDELSYQIPSDEQIAAFYLAMEEELWWHYYQEEILLAA